MGVAHHFVPIKVNGMKVSAKVQWSDSRRAQKPAASVGGKLAVQAGASSWMSLAHFAHKQR